MDDNNYEWVLPVGIIRTHFGNYVATGHPIFGSTNPTWFWGVRADVFDTDGSTKLYPRPIKIYVTGPHNFEVWRGPLKICVQKEIEISDEDEIK